MSLVTTRARQCDYHNCLSLHTECITKSIICTGRNLLFRLCALHDALTTTAAAVAAAAAASIVVIAVALVTQVCRNCAALWLYSGYGSID